MNAVKLSRNQDRRPLPVGIRMPDPESGPAPAAHRLDYSANENQKFTMSQREQDRMKQGARNYAKAFRSDPFVAATCAAHMKSGVSGFFTDAQGNKREGFYDGKLTLVQRKLPESAPDFSDGSRSWNIEEVVDVVRP